VFCRVTPYANERASLLDDSDAPCLPGVSQLVLAMCKGAVGVAALVASVVPTQPDLVREALVAYVPLLAAPKANEPSPTPTSCMRMLVHKGGDGACVHCDVNFLRTRARIHQLATCSYAYLLHKIIIVGSKLT